MLKDMSRDIRCIVEINETKQRVIKIYVESIMLLIKGTYNI